MVDFDYVWPDEARNALWQYSVENEGMVAAMCGCKLRHNPYPQESRLWQDWNEGYFMECPQRGESDADREIRERYWQEYLAEIKKNGSWEYLRPATPEERAEWANDPNPPMQTGLRRWKAKQKQRER